MSDKGFERPLDSIDEKIRFALVELMDEIPVAGKAEGWERIEGSLYRDARWPFVTAGWRFVVSVAVTLVIVVGLLRIAPVNAWGRRTMYGLKGLTGQVLELSGNLDSLADLRFNPLIVAPSSDFWVLVKARADLGNGTMGAAAFQYRNRAGVEFTLRETPLSDLAGDAVKYRTGDGHFVLKVRNVNVAFATYPDGFLTASWDEHGLRMELWGLGEASAAVSLIGELVPYTADPCR